MEEESDGSEWSFGPGDTIRDMHEKFASGGVPLGETEYDVVRQLRDENGGARFYHVKTEEGGTHLLAASAIEHSFEVVERDSV